MARLDDEALLDVGGSLEFSIRPGRSRSDLEIQRISNLVEEENADIDVACPEKPCCPLYTEGRTDPEVRRLLDIRINRL